ncbi:hypothetical protein BH10CYA1_BH10CYA1_32360 [soil metagenome]
MKQEIIRELYQLASAETQKNAAARTWFQDWSSCLFSLNLYKLACKANGVEGMLDSEVLCTFFTDAAIQALSAAPNRYWLWRLINESIVNRDENSDKIGEGAVKRAIRTVHNGVASSTNLSPSLNTLTREEACLWLACGVTVVKTDGSKVEIVLNPIFKRS